ncbi:MAG: sigma-70 family RNA polymerase sigma factor [Myxococcota bacterium]
MADPSVVLTAVPLDAAEVHDAHASFVWATLHRMGVPDADLPDLLQEVFITVHRRRSRYDGRGTVRTWLYGICRGIAANHRRKLHRRREQAIDGGAEIRELDRAGDPEAPVIARRARETVHRILETLDPDRRAVFVMFEVEGMSGPAIAAMLGVPVGTVYTRLRAARDDFARAVARHRAQETA